MIAVYLDKPLLDFIKKEIPPNSVFLAEDLVETMVPAYTNQMAFRGRRALMGTYNTLGDEILPEEARARRAAAAAFLAPETDGTLIADILETYNPVIDYLIISTRVSYLREKLGNNQIAEKIYDHNGLAIYSIK